MPCYVVIFETETINKGRVYFSAFPEVRGFVRYLLNHYNLIDLSVNRIETSKVIRNE